MVRPSTLALLLLALAPVPGAGQDVEMLGARWGTPVPEAYRALREARPDAFRFVRGRALRAAEAMEGRLAPEGEGLEMARSSLGPRDGRVEGEFRVPVLLGLFSDTPGGAPFTPETIEAAYFGAGPGTISAYYDEVSRGLLDLRGEVDGWYRAAPGRTQEWVANGNSGLGFGGRVGVFIKDLLGAAPPRDWSRYDNDGPDGVPNSGDDDGYVDAVAVLHPTRGGECGGNGADDRLWSHRWSLSSATGQPWVTSTPSANGGFIRVDDYLIQPAYSCVSGLNEIGVFTHELGHAFGLPDLYDTVSRDGQHQGAGTWDLMALGSWGCDDRSPERPCHMGAWSKLALGWVEPVEVPAGTDLTSLTLPPVAATGTVYRLRSPDGSGTYLLLENRQRTGFDASLPAEGLLVWQVDPERVSTRWAANQVNAFAGRGVWLRQADGLDDLGRTGRGRGDAGDPFPLESATRENRVFHASSSPASVGLGGGATGLTLLDIRRQGEDVTLDVLTRRFTVTVRTEGEAGPAGVFQVDGAAVAGASHAFPSAPFQLHRVEAAGGELLEPGVRRPFREWLDDPEAARVRTVVTGLEDRTLVARYAGEEVELAMEVRGGQGGVAPAEFVSTPASEDLWFARGAEVSVEAMPRTGFRFTGWTGVLEGQPNPGMVTMDGPLAAGADFELTYAAVPVSTSLEAAVDQRILLEVENGTGPVTWSFLGGELPRGMRFDPAGTLAGAALETGSFVFSLQARDALGLTSQARVTLEVTEPALGLDALAAPFLLVGSSLTQLQERFLDLAGNGNGVYDLGDFRAWILDHPELPMTAPVRALVGAPATFTLPPAGGTP